MQDRSQSLPIDPEENHECGTSDIFSSPKLGESPLGFVLIKGDLAILQSYSDGGGDGSGSGDGDGDGYGDGYGYGYGDGSGDI